MAMKNYDLIFPKMQPWQRAVLVPGLFACSNLSYYPLYLQEAQMVAKLDAYYQWGLNDSRIAGYVPWHFNTRFGNPQWAGVRCFSPSNSQHSLATRFTLTRSSARYIALLSLAASLP
jgi:hypothetical protein